MKKQKQAADKKRIETTMQRLEDGKLEALEIKEKKFPEGKLTKKEKEEIRKKYKTKTSSELVDMNIPELTWVVEGLIPNEGSIMLFGAPKTGKSWFALNLAIALSTGGTVFGSIKIQKRPVLYLALEDSNRRLNRRFMQLHGYSSLDFHYVTAKDWEYEDKAALTALGNLYKGIPELEVVIIDTIEIFRGFDHDTDYKSDVAYYHGCLQKFSEDTGLTIIGIGHTRKKDDQDKLMKAHGGVGITGSLDTNLILERTNRAGAEAELHIASRDFESDDLALRFDIDLGWEITGSAKEHRQSAERQEILTVLQDAKEPISPQEIATALGKENVNSIQRLLAKLAKEGLVVKPEYGKYEYQGSGKSGKSDTER